MYKENFKPLTEDQIKLLNHSAMATLFKCSHTYVRRVLKSTEFPKAPKAQNILNAAIKSIEEIELQGKAENDRIMGLEVITEND
tara:strand:+ start:19 stop:270 length:252 start_codon:yes stop_codon:yes gene_type:complete